MSGRRVAVVGGGVSGLVAALELARSGEGEVLLLESEPRLGGKLLTTSFRSCPLDLGPDAFVTRNGAAVALCEDLGIGGQLIPPSASSASVYARGRLRPFPPGLALGVPTDLTSLARSGIVSLPGVARAALDLVLPRRRLAADLAGRAAGGDDPTIAELVAPRLGPEVLAALVDPMLGGTNAGDSSELSFAAVAPALAERVAGERSLVRALRRQPLAAAGASANGGGEQRRPSAPLFLGLAAGLGRLAEALAEHCAAAGVELRCSTPVEAVERRGTHGAHGGGYTLHLEGSASLDIDGAVLAVPAHTAASLLSAAAPELAGECAAIPYSGVALVTAAWPSSALRSPLSGSGAIVPRTPSRLTTALTFVSTKWPRSARPGEAVVRASLGRHLDHRPLELTDEELQERALDEIAEMLGLEAAPLDVLVRRWPASFPQYVRGHLARVARIEAHERSIPGIVLAGAAYRGIGIPACIEDGRRAAARLRQVLGGDAG